ncbi:chalcone-flavanone isomerase family protein [Actinidia rufa]|uniref:Chalcone-flavanone isomerase family protein n=1 Tax=Actinidia rufa TaxID=165716 RepID=A0A7J0H990_9ERIC|nr:chalcone-flavanone isomerase family protein [Actinidia rufa]
MLRRRRSRGCRSRRLPRPQQPISPRCLKFISLQFQSLLSRLGLSLSSCRPVSGHRPEDWGRVSVSSGRFSATSRNWVAEKVRDGLEKHRCLRIWFFNNGRSSTGVYADNGDINKVLGEKYGKASASEIEKKDLIDDLMESDICMTVRLQIVYGRLSIRSVRSAFAESVGNRLQKFGGSDNKELLQRFTSQFKDEFKIPRGSIIDLSRERDNVLHTTIDGKEVGSIQSNLLCRSILDLYIGDDPFDRRAKEDIELNLASCIQKSCRDLQPFDAGGRMEITVLYHNTADVAKRVTLPSTPEIAMYQPEINRNRIKHTGTNL